MCNYDKAYINPEAYTVTEGRPIEGWMNANNACGICQKCKSNKVGYILIAQEEGERRHLQRWLQDDTDCVTKLCDGYGFFKDLCTDLTKIKSQLEIEGEYDSIVCRIESFSTSGRRKTKDVEGNRLLYSHDDDYTEDYYGYGYGVQEQEQQHITIELIVVITDKNPSDETEKELRSIQDNANKKVELSWMDELETFWVFGKRSAPCSEVCLDNDALCDNDLFQESIQDIKNIHIDFEHELHLDPQIRTKVKKVDVHEKSVINRCKYVDNTFPTKVAPAINRDHTCYVLLEDPSCIAFETSMRRICPCQKKKSN